MAEAGAVISLPVMLAVLAAALLHASWNALIRGATDKGLFTLLLCACETALGLLLLPFVGLPDSAAWPWLIASVLLHTAYIAWLMRAYDGGQLAVSYALMRGLPPLLVTLASGPLLGETLGLYAWTGILCISGGVLLIGRASGAPLRRLFGHASGRAALLNASAIAAYTLVDGQGVRLAGNPLSYAGWLFLLEPLIMLSLHGYRRPSVLRAYFTQHWRLGLGGAAASMLAYAIVLWAMTQAPVAMVAALRESSVVFAVLIGYWRFGEGRLRPGLLAATAVVVGVFFLRNP